MKHLARRLAALEAKLLKPRRRRTVLIFVSAAKQPDVQPGERVVSDYQEGGYGFITCQYRLTRDAEDTGRYSCCEGGMLEPYLLEWYDAESRPVRVADGFWQSGPDEDQGE